jgi:glycerol-3-phosphate cytidylyltransferase
VIWHMTKTILTYGTFDLFHVGHVRLLQRLRKLGDRLVVGLSSEEFNAIKGKKTVIPYEFRKEILESCRYVDVVFPENNWDQKRLDIMREQADIFAMGDDWAGKFDDLGDICEVVYIPRTPDISTTDLKKYLNAINQEKLGAIKNMVDVLHEELKKIA